MTSCLPQKDDDLGRRERLQRLEAARGTYQWNGDDPGLPPFVRSLPAAEEFPNAKDAYMFADLAGVTVALGIGALVFLAEEMGRLRRYNAFYPLHRIPSVHLHFQRDEEFGRQRLAGVNPVSIERCTAIPGNFPVTDDAISGLLRAGETLASALAEGRLYLLDYHLIQGIPAKEERFITAPICLLYVGGDGRLRPVAIQLGQSPADGPLFTPKDSPWLWQMVKTCVQVADAAYHEAASHLLRTHLAMETVAVATHRALSDRHPLFQLLAPHFALTMAINASARSTMLAPGGAIDNTLALGAAGSIELMRRSYRDRDFSARMLRNDLRLRGVDDVERLGGYHYRDDALRVESAIRDFVTGFVALFYPRDSDLTDDTELQIWARELTAADCGRISDVPGNGTIASRADLIAIVAHVIFTCSAEHSSVNNGQFDMFGYVPNVPGALFTPAPTTRAPIEEKDLVDALPGAHPCRMQIAFVHLLSQEQRYKLGDYGDAFFPDHPAVKGLVRAFNDRLASISEWITARNTLLQSPYTYLDPKQMARSISI